MILGIPSYCKQIMNILDEQGYESYVVGGCVRDTILGLSPNDWDITTNARPQTVIGIFSQADGFSAIPTGEKYGTVTVYCAANKVACEITTFRSDGNYTDGRRPDIVSFSDNIEEDLSRRDFTINAIAYNEKRGIVDLFGGREHLVAKVLRYVGDPYERLREDGLRIVRGIRFSYKLGFEIEGDSAVAIEQAIADGYLSRISKERIRSELQQILEYFDCDTKTLPLFERMIFSLFPIFERMKGFDQQTPYHVHDLWMHTLTSITCAPKDKTVRITMLLHDVGKLRTFTLDDRGVGHFFGHPQISAEIAEQLLEELKFDNKTKNDILMLIKYHDLPSFSHKKSVKRILQVIDEENFRRLLIVRAADNAAHNPILYEERAEKIRHEEELFEGVLIRNECFLLKDLKINGNDLVALGYKGKVIGKILSCCLSAVVEDDFPNERELLLELIKNMPLPS